MRQFITPSGRPEVWRAARRVSCLRRGACSRRAVGDVAAATMDPRRQSVGASSGLDYNPRVTDAVESMSSAGAQTSPLASCATSRWRIKGDSEPDRPPRDVSGAWVASPRGGASNSAGCGACPVKGSLRNRRKRMANATAPTSRVKTVIRVTSGNFLEMFDFFLFGFYATYISKAFFPSNNEAASLMLTLMTFGAGFLMRPLGAVFLGAYVDRVGRRMGLIVTL